LRACKSRWISRNWRKPSVKPTRSWTAGGAQV